jgi:hypothetical protein
MNRRELFQQLAAAATVKIPNPAIFLERSVPVLAVFEVDGYVSQEMVAKITDLWQRTVHDTAYAHVKAIVIDQHVRLALLDQHGHVLTGEADGE